MPWNCRCILAHNPPERSRWFPFLWRFATRNDAHLSWRVILCVLPIEKPRVLLLWTPPNSARGPHESRNTLTFQRRLSIFTELSRGPFFMFKVCTLLTAQCKFPALGCIRHQLHRPTIGISRMLFQVPRYSSQPPELVNKQLPSQRPPGQAVGIEC
jgi:hypothetical protein